MINHQRMRQASREKLRKFLGESFIEELDGVPAGASFGQPGVVGVSNSNVAAGGSGSDSSSISVLSPPPFTPSGSKNNASNQPVETISEVPHVRTFNRQKHVKFFERCLHCLPREYTSQDSISMTLLYFAVSGLDVLQADDVLKNERQNITDFVFRHYSPTSPANLLDMKYNGFVGEYVSPGSSVVKIITPSTSSDTPVTISTIPLSDIQHRNLELFNGEPHIVHTWAALSILLICGDNLQRIDRRRIGALVRACQLPNGSFTASPYTQLSVPSSLPPLPSKNPEADDDDLDTPFAPSKTACETDLRFLYVAAAICCIIDDFSYMNVSAARNYIEQCRSYSGGYGQVPGAEAHGGSTYCALAGLRLIRDHAVSVGPEQRECDEHRLQTCAWLAQRYDATGTGGFCGRPAKPADTCYTFWIGASLKLLMLNSSSRKQEKAGNTDSSSPASTASHNALHLLIGAEEVEHVSAFALEAQHEYAGGFAKWPDHDPDLLHAYLCLAGLSILHDHLKTCARHDHYSAEQHCIDEQRLEKSFATTFFGGDEQLLLVNAELNITERTVRWLKQLHQEWRTKGVL